MVVSCPELCRPDLEPRDPGSAQRLDRVIAVVTGFCPNVEVVADGRGEAAMTRTRWLWLPAENGGVAVADPRDLPADFPFDIPANFPADSPVADLPFTRAAPVLRAVSAG